MSLKWDRVPAMDVCTIDFTLDDSRASMHAFLRRVAPMLNEFPDIGTGWVVDCERCQYLGPDAAALLFALHLDAIEHGGRVDIRLPAAPPALASFCSYSWLSHWLHGGPTADPSHPANETVPLEQFSAPRANQADALVNLIRRHAELQIDEEDYLRICIGEVAQNIADHAQSPIGGVSCARFIASSRQVRVAIVDRGVGIPNSLRGRHPELHDDQVALRRVLEGNYSSKTYERNMGLGISNLGLVVKNLTGDLVIVSGGATVETRTAKTPRFFENPAYFHGTCVFFTLRV